MRKQRAEQQAAQAQQAQLMGAADAIGKVGGVKTDSVVGQAVGQALAGAGGRNGAGRA